MGILERILQMKFLEELTGGDCFKLDDLYFLLTRDYKSGKDIDSRNCISIKDGSPRWIKTNTMVELVPIFTLDSNSNIIPIKETPKENAPVN